MATPFIPRLASYFLLAGRVLRNEAAAASIFPNPSDIGQSRERLYAEFLRLHLPSFCGVVYGGFLFSLEGEESKQIDIIINSGVSPQFNLLNPDGEGKSFACVDGTLGVVSVKSMLDATGLQDALWNLASIPHQRPLTERTLSPLVRFPGYENWPFKIIFATDGIAGKTLLAQLNAFFEANPSIPETRRPNLIHVLGKYFIQWTGPDGGQTKDGTLIAPNIYHLVQLSLPQNADIHALAMAVMELTKAASNARFLVFEYHDIQNRLWGFPPDWKPPPPDPTDQGS
ncbi:MAG: hypothetical protein IH988_00735 [Planctomycetes bacterium]|nr:hypothetical protein [Planctomycetota bacterium]